MSPTGAASLGSRVSNPHNESNAMIARSKEVHAYLGKISTPH